MAQKGRVVGIKVYPPEELVVNQSQQSDRGLGPLSQPPKAAAHDLTPSVAPILSRERARSGPGGKTSHFPLQALPPTLGSKPHCSHSGPTAPSLGRIPACRCAEAPLGAPGALGAQSGSALRSSPGERGNLRDALDGERPATSYTLTVGQSLPFFSKKPHPEGKVPQG